MTQLGISTRILVVEQASFLMELVDLHEDYSSFDPFSCVTRGKLLAGGSGTRF